MIIKDDRFEGNRIKALIYEGECWELYKTFMNSSLLLVMKSVYDRWIVNNLLYAGDPFIQTEIDGTEYVYLLSDEKYLLLPVKNGLPLCDRKIALTFAAALKRMRERTRIPFGDGIFIEEYGYLLPVHEVESPSDDIILGSFLAGGRRETFYDGKIVSPFLDETVYCKISEITGLERQRQEPPKIAEDEPKQPFVLAGRRELSQFFQEHIINILNEPERYQKLGIDFPSAVLLYGPPGCGKTFAVEKLIEYLGLPSFEINSATIASPYIHDTAKKISRVFETAISKAPSIVVIDEMESYLSDRNAPTSNSQHLEEVAEFLRQVQNAQKNHVLIIAMTNMYEKIDPAILRRGRFDHHIEVGLPSEEEIYQLLLSITKNIVLSADIDLKQLAAQLTGKTLADVTFIIREAGLISGKNGLDAITADSIQTAVSHLPKEEQRRRIGF